MSKAKRFQARIPRNQPYSTNAETARIREIDQSRVGLDIEIVRINGKFRTRLSRAKAGMRRTDKWKKSSKKQQLQQEEELEKKIEKEEEEELQVVVQEWVKLTGMEEMVIDQEDASNNEDIDDEDESDPEFEDGDIDALEDEDLFDVNGNKVETEDLSIGMKEIYNRHLERVRSTMAKYQVIDGEDEKKSDEEDGWETEVENEESSSS